jgi:protein O-GlcNAc transferase
MVDQLLRSALEHHRAGRLQEAERVCHQILARESEHPDSLHLLGVLAHQSGNSEAAADFIGRAIAVAPENPDFHSRLGEIQSAAGQFELAVAAYRRTVALSPRDANAHCCLGNALWGAGKRDEAIVAYRQAIALEPNNARHHGNLGNALRLAKGGLDEAISECRRTVELDPSLPEAYCNLGNALHDRGDLDAAVASYRKAMDLNPDLPEVHSNLGNCLRALGRLEEAIASYQKAISLRPDYAEAFCNLGIVLNSKGQLAEAVSAYLNALMVRPAYPEARKNLGNALMRQGRCDEAIDNFQQAISLKPNYPEAYNSLAFALNQKGDFEAAIEAYRQAIALWPAYAEAFNNLGSVMKDQGRLEEAISYYRRALELDPKDNVAHSNILLTLNYCSGITLAELAEAHAGFEQQQAAAFRHTFAPRTAASDRGRIRFGFVSPDFGMHPVGQFLIRLLENLRLEQRSETYCYSDRIARDQMTGRLKAESDGWRDMVGASDEQLALQIRDDDVDVLFDLAGHTGQNRLLVFARKPAPVQVTWAGYVGTTGLQAMDYVLADRFEIPTGAESYYQEEVLRMPDGWVCYAPPAYAPQVTALPALQSAGVTFGCFNNPAKITPQAIEVWARILRRLPEARLVLMFKGWDNPGLARRAVEMFELHGIDPARLEFRGWSLHDRLLAEYQRVDVALDPFPYAGGLTTCEALWMGVPVVTCPFETFASRHSLSHLSNIGLTETIARDLDDYVETAVRLATDLPRLAELRAGLRERVAASPLCDGKRFARNFLELFANVWRSAGDRGYDF